MSLLTVRRLRYWLGRIAQRIAPVLQLWDTLNFSVSVFGVAVIIYDIGFPKNVETETFVCDMLHTMTIGLLVSNILRLGADLIQWRSIEGHFHSIKGQVGVIALLFIYLLMNGMLPHTVHGWLPHAILAALFMLKASQTSLGLSNVGLEPALVVSLSFLVMIFVGTGLLLMPNSTHNGISVVDALFTSTSAICVTGLATVDVEFTFTFTGKVILVSLIQIGGLGIMTLTSFLGNFFTGGSGVKHRLMVKEMIATERIGEVMGLLRNVILLTFSLELLGAVFIYFTVGPSISADFSERVWFSVFHAISSFCNAGFSTLSPGLAHPALQFNAPFLLSISGLIIIGGIGYPILFNYANYFSSVVRSRWRSVVRGVPLVQNPRIINMHTKIVLSVTVSLIIFGTVVFYLLERNHILAGMSHSQAFISSFFASVSPRTAGFNTLMLTEVTAGSVVLMYFLMWVGGSPASTAGGIKTTTFALAFANIFSLGKDKFRVELFGRELPSSNVRRAFAVVMLSVVFIGIGVLALSITENEKDVGKLVFECISAFATVGLTLGLTPTLTSAGKLVLIILMFLGRVGALTIIAGIIPDLRYQRYRYPEENIMIT
jgi:Trk-type K+ transport system membrane component